MLDKELYGRNAYDLKDMIVNTFNSYGYETKDFGVFVHLVKNPTNPTIICLMDNYYNEDITDYLIETQELLVTSPYYYLQNHEHLPKLTSGLLVAYKLVQYKDNFNLIIANNSHFLCDNGYISKVSKQSKLIIPVINPNNNYSSYNIEKDSPLSGALFKTYIPEVQGLFTKTHKDIYMAFKGNKLLFVPNGYVSYKHNESIDKNIIRELVNSLYFDLKDYNGLPEKEK